MFHSIGGIISDSFAVKTAVQLRSILFFLVLSGVCALSVRSYGEKLRARFEPPSGKVLLIIGQSLEDIQAYENSTHVVPGGFMAYTSVQAAEGLTDLFNQGDGSQEAQMLVDQYPNAALQIGLYMVDACESVARGEMDSQIDKIATWIQKTRRPVYLRVGYEFDGPHNHYPPKEYVAAYRHVVDRFRTLKVRNVAYVWHSYASRSSRPLTDWYPGDGYVDWFGISYFNQPQRYMQPMVDLAKQHGKPVMISEGSPWVVQTKYTNAWNLWFVPLFKFMAANDIKALSYIGCNWDATKQFETQRWGDTRLQSNPEILHHWSQETSQDRYLKASPELFNLLGFDPVANQSSRSPSQ
jgi:hypothetical protein